MSEKIVSRPYPSDSPQACERCVFGGSKPHAEWCYLANMGIWKPLAKDVVYDESAAPRFRPGLKRADDGTYRRIQELRG